MEGHHDHSSIRLCLDGQICWARSSDEVALDKHARRELDDTMSGIRERVPAALQSVWDGPRVARKRHLSRGKNQDAERIVLVMSAVSTLTSNAMLEYCRIRYLDWHENVECVCLVMKRQNVHCLVLGVAEGNY